MKQLTPVDTVNEFYSALGSGDVPRVLSLLQDELEWTEAERFPYFSGTWRSPQEVLEKLLIPLSRDWEAFAAIPHDSISEGNRVVSLGTYTGTYKTTGRAMIAPFAHVWTVVDGRIAKFVMYVDTAKVLEALNPKSREA